MFGSPQRYSVHRARDKNETLTEAVVSVDRGRVDLSNSFRQMPRGSYSVTLKNISLTRTQPIGSLSVSDAVIDWIPGKVAALISTRLMPGVWEISAKRTDENPYLASPNIAWVLLVDESHFDVVNRDFATAAMATENWAKAVTPEAKRRVVRASLDHLALVVRQ
jgi:hypothetical protein